MWDNVCHFGISGTPRSGAIGVNDELRVFRRLTVVAVAKATATANAAIIP
jgi:hypothetical protein